MIAEELIVKIRAETDKAVREINKVERSSDKATSSLVGFARAAVNIGKLAATVAVIRNASRGLTSLADSAANAEDTFDKFNTVFRSVGRDATGAMEDLAESFGLANSTAARLLGNTGDILTGFGLTQEAALELSDATSRLAIDLASFTGNGATAADVSRALTAAYTGERESLKTYGIVLTEADVQARVLKNTMEGLTFESDRQAKAFATLQLAQEQSTNAIGDYERTSDSSANVARRLNETIIQLRENFGLLADRAVTPAREALTEFLEEVNALFTFRRAAEEASTALEIFYETGEAMGVSGSALDVINTQIEAMRRGINAYSDSMTRMRDNNMEVTDDMNRRFSIMLSDLNRAEEAWVALSEASRDSGEDATEATETVAEAASNAGDQMQRIAAQQKIIAKEMAEYQRRMAAVGSEFMDPATEAMSEFSAEALAVQNDMKRLASQSEESATEIANNWRGAFSAISGSAMQTFSMLVSLQAEQTNRQIQAIDAQLEAMQDRFDREVAFAEAAGASDEELADLRAQQLEEEQEAEAAADERKKALATKQFKRQQALNVANVIQQTALAVVRAFADLGPIAGPIAAAAIGSLGAAQLGIISQQQPPAFERGGSFVTSGPQAIMVGDGQSPRERVTVEPLSGPYRSGGGGVTINISGVIGDRERVAEWVNEGIRRGQARGAIRG